MRVTRASARWLVGIAAALVIFLTAFIYGSSFRWGAEERRIIGVYTGHGHTIIFHRDGRFSYTTQHEDLRGTWSRRTDQPTGFRLVFQDSPYTGVAALVTGSFAGERGDLALGVSDYWVVLRRAPLRSLFVGSPKSPNQAMQRTASTAAIDAVRVCHPPFGCESRTGGLAVADLVSR